MHAHAARQLPSFDEVVRFHGHRCPGLALGYRAAQVALDELPASRSHDEELLGILENDACGIDAFIYVTGCTPGKGNLIQRDWGKHAYTLVRRSDGTGVRVTTRPDYRASRAVPDFAPLRERAMSGSATEDEKSRYAASLDRVIAAVLTGPAGEIFTWSRVQPELPPRARVYRSLTCESCGESVAEHRARNIGGHVLCIPCAGEQDGPC